jgi:hypothetical protein
MSTVRAHARFTWRGRMGGREEGKEEGREAGAREE